MNFSTPFSAVGDFVAVIDEEVLWASEILQSKKTNASSSSWSGKVCKSFVVIRPVKEETDWIQKSGIFAKLGSPPAPVSYRRLYQF